MERFTDSIVQFLNKFIMVCLRCLPAELAHDLGIYLLRKKSYKIIPKPKRKGHYLNLESEIPGLGKIKHPIGLAAGFDKNAVCADSLADLGFSFVEVGAVTPLAQRGHNKPRMFRQADKRALINRMGFNNEGANQVAKNIKQLNWQFDSCSLGINVGINKSTPVSNALEDYLYVMRSFSKSSSYFSINLSSPNTDSLKSLQDDLGFLDSLADALEMENELDINNVWLKLSPNLSKKTFQKIIEKSCENSFAGVVLSNTMPVTTPYKGGMSGHPLLLPSTRCLEWAWDVHSGSLPMIGVGGILSGEDVYEKIIRGACAVQIYTAFVYRGPWAVSSILNEFTSCLKEKGFESVKEAYGSYYTN